MNLKINCFFFDCGFANIFIVDVITNYSLNHVHDMKDSTEKNVNSQPFYKLKSLTDQIKTNEMFDLFFTKSSRIFLENTLKNNKC